MIPKRDVQRSMTDVPKIVLGRLRRASNPGNHPGADLLTAFAEQALAKRERLHVLEHLAQCSECREIVSLARPEIAEPQTSLKLFSLRSPILRWSAVAACVVVVGAVVTTRHLAQKNVETRVTAKAPFSDTKDASQGVDLKTDLTAKLQPQPLAKQDSVLSHGLAKQRKEAAANSRALAINAEKAGTAKKEPLAAAVPAAPSSALLPKAMDQEQQKKITYDSLGSAAKSGNEAVMNETVATSASVEVADARPGKAKDAKDSRMKAPMAVSSGVGGAAAPVTANQMIESRAELNRAVNLTPRWNQIDRPVEFGSRLNHLVCRYRRGGSPDAGTHRHRRFHARVLGVLRLSWPGIRHLDRSTGRHGFIHHGFVARFRRRAERIICDFLLLLLIHRLWKQR